MKKIVITTIIVAVGLFLGYFILFPVNVYIMHGNTMTPTIKAGDKFFINKNFTTINYDDIIAFNYTIPKTSKQVMLIKRVIGLPGDSIKINSGIIYVDGKKIRDKDTKGSISLSLGKNEYFVIGDNPKIGIDSRLFGALKFSSIAGKVNLK